MPVIPGANSSTAPSALTSAFLKIDDLEYLTMCYQIYRPVENASKTGEYYVAERENSPRKLAGLDRTPGSKPPEVGLRFGTDSFSMRDLHAKQTVSSQQENTMSINGVNPFDLKTMASQVAVSAVALEIDNRWWTQVETDFVTTSGNGVNLVETGEAWATDEGAILLRNVGTAVKHLRTNTKRRGLTTTIKPVLVMTATAHEFILYNNVEFLAWFQGAGFPPSIDARATGLANYLNVGAIVTPDTYNAAGLMGSMDVETILEDSDAFLCLPASSDNKMEHCVGRTFFNPTGDLGGLGNVYEYPAPYGDKEMVARASIAIKTMDNQAGVRMTWA